MHLAVCDDDVNHISYIAEILDTYRQEKVVSLRWTSFPSGFALLAALDQGESFDAVLLDIYMSDMNGMEVAKHIRAMNNNMHILFLTSSAMFAVESYCVEATDYLLKPIKKERLFQSLDKLFSRMDASTQQGITVKDTDGRIIKVLWNQLMYLEAMGHYVVFHHANGTSTKTFVSFSSLMEQLLSHGDFIQSHRSYIVNLRYVHRIEKRALVMLDGAQLPLPKSRYQQLTDCFHDIIFGGDAL
jgi:DNA-binding LytR/AlgR family response regulator